MRRKGPLLATLLAACVGAAILVTAFLIEPGAERDAPVVKPRIVEATDLQAPAALRPDEGMAGGKALDAQGVSLSQGAWVQVADESGKLAQQYSASRIDPERDKWMRMEQPRAVMYPSGGRMVTMKADRGRMRVPQRAIESGRLEGSVVIRMYKPVDGKAIDTDHDEPALVVQADEALFDNRLGEIRWQDHRAPDGGAATVADPDRAPGGHRCGGRAAASEAGGWSAVGAWTGCIEAGRTHAGCGRERRAGRGALLSIGAGAQRARGASGAQGAHAGRRRPVDRGVLAREQRRWQQSCVGDGSRVRSARCFGRGPAGRRCDAAIAAALGRDGGRG